MTLFLVYDEYARDDTSLEQSHASKILGEAIAGFLSQKQKTVQ
jgi:hypothetical protein